MKNTRIPHDLNHFEAVYVSGHSHSLLENFLFNFPGRRALHHAEVLRGVAGLRRRRRADRVRDAGRGQHDRAEGVRGAARDRGAGLHHHLQQVQVLPEHHRGEVRLYTISQKHGSGFHYHFSSRQTCVQNLQGKRAFLLTPEALSYPDVDVEPL